MLEQNIKEEVREKLLQDLRREPSEEEVEAEMGNWEQYIKEQEKEGIFPIGLYRRFSNRNLQDAIAEKRLTYKDIQKGTGIGINTMSRVVNFKRNPSEEQRIKIAIFLEVPIDRIFPEEYDELYDRISPLPVEAEAEIKMKRLDSSEVLKIEAPDFTEEVDSKIFTTKTFPKIAKGLTPREQKILRMRFGFEEEGSYTLEEVAREFGVTRERIRQTEARAIEKIREKLKGKERLLLNNICVVQNY